MEIKCINFFLFSSQVLLFWRSTSPSSDTVVDDIHGSISGDRRQGHVVHVSPANMRYKLEQIILSYGEAAIEATFLR